MRPANGGKEFIELLGRADKLVMLLIKLRKSL
ncbi:hypothetical protein ALAU109921_17460 [Alteromonas australica]